MVLFWFLSCIDKKKRQSSCKLTDLNLLYNWSTILSFEEDSESTNELLLCLSASHHYIKFKIQYARAEHDFVSEQFQGKPFVCTAYCYEASTQVGNRWERERERQHCATCLVIHFKADASPTTALKQHTRHTPPLSFACLSPQNTIFHLNLFSLLTIIEA